MASEKKVELPETVGIVDIQPKKFAHCPNCGASNFHRAEFVQFPDNVETIFRIAYRCLGCNSELTQEQMIPA